MGERIGWDFQTPIELGIPEFISVSDPTLGDEIDIVVPENTLWSIVLLKFRFTAGPTAATRLIHLAVSDGAGVKRIGYASATMVAGATRDIYCQHAGMTANVAQEVFCRLPPRFYLRPLWELLTVTDNRQADDQFSSIVLYVHRWLVST